MEKNSSLEIAALTLGVLSIIFFYFLFICVPCGVLAIIYGAKVKKLVKHGGKSGIVTGIVGLSLCVAFNATMITLFSTGVLRIC